jgi:hypothetical protein
MRNFLGLFAAQLLETLWFVYSQEAGAAGSISIITSFQSLSEDLSQKQVLKYACEELLSRSVCARHEPRLYGYAPQAGIDLTCVHRFVAVSV